MLKPFNIQHSAFSISMPVLRALETIRRHGLLRAGDRVLVGLSGGADSVSLLLVLRELESRGVLRVAGVAHLNHQLRGTEADEDQEFCEALAARLGLPCVVERTDVAALARAQRRSVEDAARVARYAFFERAAAVLAADAIAVAHTKEDQAETFLLRLLRGAGTRGLAAIQPRAGRVIRPFLDIERQALREYLASRHQAFREDTTNADVTIARNRIRHELIPFLQSHFSPGVTDVLARSAALARQDEEFLGTEAIKWSARIVLTDVEGSALDVAALREAPRALGSRVVHAALQRLAGARPIHFDHVDALLALLDDGESGGRAVSLPGQDAVRRGETIILRPAPARHRAAANGFAFPLSIPGEVLVGTRAVGAERVAGAVRPGARQTEWVGRGPVVGVAEAALDLPLSVRSRRPGDRFRPLGAPGRRKLQDFLVDRKVARRDRDTLPLVVDGQDRIVWVVGQAVAEDFRVTDPSQGVILLRVRHLGGLG